MRKFEYATRRMCEDVMSLFTTSFGSWAGFWDPSAVVEGRDETSKTQCNTAVQ